jgi:predicted RNase H-like HicB family nuclease
VELTVLVQRDATGYWSQVKELPGCFASAGTLEELREAVGEAIGLYLNDEPLELGDVQMAVGEVMVDIPNES